MVFIPSRWWHFVVGLEPEMQMPPPDSHDEFPPLSREEISLLRAWIDQGAQWPTNETATEE